MVSNPHSHLLLPTLTYYLLRWACGFRADEDVNVSTASTNTDNTSNRRHARGTRFCFCVLAKCVHWEISSSHRRRLRSRILSSHAERGDSNLGVVFTPFQYFETVALVQGQCFRIRFHHVQAHSIHIEPFLFAQLADLGNQSRSYPLLPVGRVHKNPVQVDILVAPVRLRSKKSTFSSKVKNEPNRNALVQESKAVVQ